ncbi:MAG: hypothetical protein N3F66_02265 [Spirochaetes bacterium]|nr:hypothetical protein [Spirochaetota bacterium]
MKKNKILNHIIFTSMSSLLIISFLFAQQENVPKEKTEEMQNPQAEIVTPKEEQKETQPKQEMKQEIKIEKVKGKKKEEEKYFTLNFKDVELSEFIEVMSQLIGKNIVIDERVRGKITVSSVKKIPIKDAYEVMKAILELKGFAVVESENLIKILPIKDAIKKNVEVIIDTTK